MKKQSTLMTSLEDNLKAIGLAGGNNENVLASIANESMDVTGHNENVQSSLTQSKITGASAAAAMMIATYAIAGEKGAVALEDKNPLDGQLVNFNSDYDGLEGSASRNKVALESFDGQAVTQRPAYIIAFNAQASQQADDVAAALFPTVVIDPKDTGLTVALKRLDIIKNLTRSASGAKLDKYRSAFVEAMKDDSILDSGSTTLYPVYRTGENATTAWLLGDSAFRRTVDRDGEEIITAPLLFGKEIDLIGISQTTKDLAAGGTDVSDALDSSVALSTVTIQVHDDGDGVLSYTTLDVKGFNGSRFVHTVQGNSKDLNLDMNINTLSLKATTLLQDGSALSSVITGLGDYTVRLAIDVTGRGNTANGNIKVNANTIEIHSILDVDGVALDATSTEYTTIANALTLAFAGYTLEARLVNSNARSLGTIVDVSNNSVVYPVRYKAPISVFAPVINTGIDNGANQIDQHSIVTATAQGQAGIKRLFEALDSIKLISSDVASATDFIGAGKDYVTPYYNNVSYSVDANFDSVQSSKRRDDIAGALAQVVRTEISQMYTISGYNFATKALRGNSKSKVVVATDAAIGGYLVGMEDKLKINSDMEVVIVTSANPRMSNKIVVSFGSVEAGSNTPDIISFGTHVYAPEIVAEVKKATVGSNQVTAQIVAPRYEHFVNIPVAALINVTGMDKLASKNVINMRTVS